MLAIVAQARVFKSLTGVTVAEFDELYEKVQPIWSANEVKRLSRRERKRAIGGGRDNDADDDRVQPIVAGVLDDALAEIAARLDTRGENDPVVVYNPLAWMRSAPVRLTLRLNAPPRRLVVRDSDGLEMATQTFSVRQNGHYWDADVLFVARRARAGLSPLSRLLGGALGRAARG